MSIACCLLREALEEGSVDVVNFDPEIGKEYKLLFPNLVFSDNFQKPMTAKIERKPKIEPINTATKLYDSIKNSAMVEDQVAQPTVTEEKKVDMAARKKFRKFMINGGKYNSSYPIMLKNGRKKPQQHIYREIFYEKMSGSFAIPREAFQNVVEDIMEESHPDYEIEEDALVALQRESEMMITKMMCLAYHLTDHASRETLLAKDFKLLAFLFKKNKEGCSFEM